MSIGLRLGLLIVSLFATAFIIFCIVKNKLNIKYSIVWLLWAMLTIVMSIFPETFYAVADLLGIELPVNAVFLIMSALLYGLTFFLYLTISKHNEEIIQLTYEIADLKKKVEELKKK